MIISIFTGIVLLVLNIFCSQFCRDQFYRSKQVTLVDKALLTAEELGDADVMTSETAEQVANRLGGFENIRLLVTDTDAAILYDSEKLLPAGQQAPFSQIQRALEGRDVFTWQYSEGLVTAETAIPIVGYNSISGCLYLQEIDQQQGRFIHALQSGICIVSILLELILVIFSITYAYRFSSRLRKITSSMHIIQNGNYSHKVVLEGNDELTMFAMEFNNLTDQLQVSEEKRRQFVSDASHELKTPLASIKLLTDSIFAKRNGSPDHPGVRGRYWHGG